MDVYESPVNSIAETGSLTARAPEESHFIGSSSGVYFINTVKRAFNTSGNEAVSSRLPAAEETVGGEEDLLPSRCASPDARPSLRLDVGSNGRLEISSAGRLGSLPPRGLARQLAILYFKHWHPLFPFLSGPKFLQNLEVLHDEVELANQEGLPINRQRLCSLVMFQCVFNIGAAHLPSSDFPHNCRIPSPTDLLSMIGSLSARHDLQTIQAALAAQLFCVSTMALRTASSLGSLIVKLMMHAGLHRCPFRYGQLSDEDRGLRKRIFWSAYALDRYLSQALGLPLTISDTDIDVCMPTWTEIHRPAQEHLANTPNADRHYHSTSPEQTRRESVHQIHLHDGQSAPPFVARSEHGGQTPSVNASGGREIALARYIEYGRLLGRALELYHKSLHVRSVDHSNVLFLRSDVDHWFNNLPSALQTFPSRMANTKQSQFDLQLTRFSLFFTVLYQQLIILINRPSLSLHRSLPEFQSGLQITLSAARATIAALEQHEHLFWPGYLASVWMSGLIVSFACQVHLYDTAKGLQSVCILDLKWICD